MSRKPHQKISQNDIDLLKLEGGLRLLSDYQHRMYAPQGHGERNSLLDRQRNEKRDCREDEQLKLHLRSWERRRRLMLGRSKWWCC